MLRFEPVSPIAPLVQLRQTFTLSDQQLAAIFQVTPAAIRTWLTYGPPTSVAKRIWIMAVIGEFLTQRVEPATLPALLLTGVDAYEGRSMFEMFVAGREREVRREINAAFDWASG